MLDDVCERETWKGSAKPFFWENIKNKEEETKNNFA